MRPPDRRPPRKRPDLTAWTAAAALAVAPAAFSFQLDSFTHAKLAVAAMGTLLVAIAAAAGGASLSPGLRAFAPLWLFLGYCSVLYVGLGIGRTPSRSLLQVAEWTALVLLACLVYPVAVKERGRAVLHAGLLLGGLLGGIAALLQLGGYLGWVFPEVPGNPMYSVFGNAELLGGYMAIAAALAAAAATRRRGAAPLAMAAFVVCAGALVMSGSRGAWLAGLAGLAAGFPYGQLRERAPRRAYAAIAAGCALAVVALAWAAPALTWDRLRDLFSGDCEAVGLRLWFWEGAAHMIADHPLLGVGPAHYAYWSPSYLGEALRSGLPNGAFNEVHTIYAHSDPLQLWAETGVVGVAVVGWMVLRVARRPSMYWGPLAAFAVFSLTSFPSYAVAHLLAALACAGMALAAGGGERQDAVEGQGGAGWAVAAALVLCVLIAMGQTLPGYLSRRAAALHQKGRIEAAEAAYRRRLAYPWPAYEARRRYGILLLEEGRYEEAEDQSRAALAGLDTGGLYVGLSRALLERARWADAARAAEQAQWRWPGAVDPYVLLGASSLSPETGELRARARAWLERAELTALERALGR